MKSQNTFSILFWINASRAKNNEAEIYARVTVNQKRINISLKRKVAIQQWHTKKRFIRKTFQVLKQEQAKNQFDFLLLTICT